MNKICTLIAAAACAAALTACGGSGKLARDIQGTWQANPAPVAGSTPGIMTMTDSWTFVGDDAKATGGQLIVSSMASVECPLDFVASDTIAPASAPYAVTVAATVSLSGSWDLDSHDPDDEILVSFDPKTLNVQIDPAAAAVSTDGNPATIDSIPPALFAEAHRQIVATVQKRFFPVNRLEDVEVKGNSLKFELPPLTEGGHDTKVTLRKQGPDSGQ